MKKYWEEKLETMPHGEMQEIQRQHLRATLERAYEKAVAAELLASPLRICSLRITCGFGSEGLA